MRGDLWSRLAALGDRQPRLTASSGRRPRLSGLRTRASDDVRLRIVAVFTLVVLGLSLAAVGSVLGVDESLTGSDSDAEVAISGDNITVTAEGDEVVAVDDMRDVHRVEIVTRDGQFSIHTERKPPLTEGERESAIDVALSNDTVGNALAVLDDYEVTVEPVRQLDAATATNGTEIGLGLFDDPTASDGRATNATADIDVSVAEAGDNSVIIHREATHVEGKVLVTVVETSTDRRVFSVVVDLTDETVVSYGRA